MAHADKRSVHTDALETLGTIISEKEARDAIHLAVEPVIAGSRLEPGEHVFLKQGVAYFRHSTGEPETIGIVDPFLTKTVQEGERFWLVVYPRKITSLRHVWTHPAFDAVPDLPSPVRMLRSVPAVADDWGAPAEIAPVKEQPSFDAEKAEAQRALESFAGSIGSTLEELVERARDYKDRGEFWVEGGRFEGQGTPPDFWDNYEKYTGEKVADDDRGGFFSCSC